MNNFYPGPSKVYPFLKEYFLEAFESGILEKNHRSKDFMDLLEESNSLLKNFLNIPHNYKIFITSSATECWEICAQSLFKSSEVDFNYNGSFGEKWKTYASRSGVQTFSNFFDLNQKIAGFSTSGRDVCMVVNETSNGTAIRQALINNVYNSLGDELLVLDAVSSLGGVNYDISKADVWITSSQKCFGLPSGMGIMILSPKALERSKKVNDNAFYNSLLFLEENFDRYQTPYTPNIFLIFLLNRLLQKLENVNVLSEKIAIRAKLIYSFFDQNSYLSPLISNDSVRSETIIAVKSKNLPLLFSYLNRYNITVGKGYGYWADHTFRLANFPAIEDTEFDYLLEILSNFTPN